MLSQIKPTLEEIARAVATLDDAAMDEESVGYMIKYLPTSDEVESVRLYDGDPDRLGKAERYFRALVAVPGYESKLRALQFKQGFRAAVSQIREWTRVVECASRELRGSARMGRLMALVLNLGNALNANRGVARADSRSRPCPNSSTRVRSTAPPRCYIISWRTSRAETKSSSRSRRNFRTSSAPRGSRSRWWRRSWRRSAVASRRSRRNSRRRRRARRCWTRVTPRNARRRRDDAWSSRRRMARGSPRDVLGSFDDEEEERREAEEEARRAEEEAAERADAKNERDFRESLREFHATASRTLEECATNLEAAKGSFRNLATYFGEDAAKIKTHQEPERLAKVVRDFSGSSPPRGKIAERWTPRRRARRRGRTEKERGSGGGEDAGAVARRLKKTDGEKRQTPPAAVVARQAQTGGEEHVPRG